MNELIKELIIQVPFESRRRLERVIAFASNAHEGQFRKGGEPYINHPINVAFWVSQHGYRDYDSLAAALLHDVVEDTKVTIEDIYSAFGHEIAGLVFLLTKPYEGKGSRRVYYEVLKHSSLKVQAIKIGDRISNLSDLFLLDDNEDFTFPGADKPKKLGDWKRHFVTESEDLIKALAGSPLLGELESLVLSLKKDLEIPNEHSQQS